MSMTSASAQYFEKMADQWDNLRSSYFTEAVRDAAISKAYLHAEMIVADVGAGTGYMAARLAPLVKKVHVLDGSQAMLEIARKNLAGFQNIEFHLADGQSLPLPNGSVDVAYANMYLHHCPDPLVAIQEMVRILKPGGRLVITDMDAHNYSWMKEEMADTWLGFERNQIRTWLEEAGLVNIIVDCTGQSCSAQSGSSETMDEKDRSANVSIFLATGTRRIRMREQVENAYATLAQGGCGCGSKAEAQSTQIDEVEAKAACCSSENDQAQDTTSSNIYTPDEFSSVPAEAGEISLGCGNPIALASLKPGEVVVDIGSGGGMDSFLAARKVGNNGKVIGVDMTQAMLDRARRTAQKAGITNVEFRRGQAEALPVDDHSVDVILSNCVINLTEDKGLVFREAFRVLKPGGRLEVSDIVTSGSMSLEARQDAMEWAGCVSGALPEQEYLDLISQAGFGNVTVRRSTQVGETGGVKVFSAIVSAQKPRNPVSQDETEVAVTEKTSTCCGGSSCCG